jgi:hypothetical protein
VVVANCAVAVATFPDATSATNVIVCVADCPASRLVLTFTVPEGATVVPLTVTRICAAPVVRVLNCDEISMRNVHEAAEFGHLNLTRLNTTTGVVESATVLAPTTILVRMSCREGDGNVARGTTRSLYGSPDWANAGPFPEQASARSRAKPPIPTLGLVTAFLPGVCVATSICVVLFALSNLRPRGGYKTATADAMLNISRSNIRLSIAGKIFPELASKEKWPCLQFGEGPVRFPKSVRAWPQFQGRVSYIGRALMSLLGHWTKPLAR